MATGADQPLATVFGATGYLGRRVTRALADAGYRVRAAARNPSAVSFSDLGDRVEPVEADVRDAGTIAAAIGDAAGVVNAVGLYTERGDESFAAIHVDGAGRVAAAARVAGARLVHLSGIGADPGSPSKYVRARAHGEARVRATAPDATILRPSVLFGYDDAFLGALVGLVRALPVIPLFGDGRKQLQPVHVDDVAAAIVKIFALGDAAAPLYELGGARAYAYRDLLAQIAARLERKRLFVPVPFIVWNLLAAVMSVLPSPPLSRDQIELMRDDNLPAADLPGLTQLGIAPRGIDAALTELSSPHPGG